ncbi:hypothetical protein FTX61_17060 [Nitriliruptoraceae bacterium ZYF776]|nr:hypothetical protein [Profundirhabdus halotolerans]
MAVWVPVSKALRRFGPLVGPWLLRKARDEAQPYWQAYQQARRVDGYLGAWQDERGKHWVVLGDDGRTFVGAYPTMSRQQRDLATGALDPDALQHHEETVLHRLATAPAKARETLAERRDRDR